MRYVRAVAETRSFSAAEKSHGVSEPALSKGTAKRGTTLRARLLQGSPSGETRTAFGEAMLPRIERALAALDDVRAEAVRWNARAPEVVRVGVSPLIDPKLVASAYPAVCGHPGQDAHRQLVLREAN